MAWIFLCVFFVLFFLTIFLKYTNNEQLFPAIYVQCTSVNKYDVSMGVRCVWFVRTMHVDQ